MIKYSEVSKERQLRAEQALLSAGLDVVVNWESTKHVNGSQVSEVICNKCGDITTRTTRHLVSGKFQCFNCVKQFYIDKLTSLNFKYISHIPNIVNCSCNVCGNERNIATSSLAISKSISCEYCDLQSYKEKAKSIGYNFLSKTGNKVLLECRKDFTKFEAHLAALHTGFIACEECRLSKYKERLAIKNCEFIKYVWIDVNGRNLKYIEYKTENGDVFVARAGNVLSNKFTIHEEGHWRNPNKLYLIELLNNDTLYYKIGIAVDPSFRLYNLKLDGKARLFVLGSYTNRWEAQEVETALHKEFSQFSLSEDIPKSFTNGTKSIKAPDGSRIYRKDGITEWFSKDVFDLLKSRFNL